MGWVKKPQVLLFLLARHMYIYVLAVRQGGGAGAGDGPLSPPAVRAQRKKWLEVVMFFLIKLILTENVLKLYLVKGFSYRAVFGRFSITKARAYT
jgi:hypothetical protein